MAEVRYVPNRGGMRSLMRSTEMQHLMIDWAHQMADVANRLAEPDFKTFQYYGMPYYDVGPTNEPVTGIVSAHAFVRTANYAAQVDNAENDTLQKIV